MKWIDGLLEVFRKEITTEGRFVLLPQLQLMDTWREKMVKQDETEAAKQYSDSVASQQQKAMSEATFHGKYEEIKKSNSKRNALLLATKFPTWLFNDIAFPASIIAVNNPSFETEEIAIEDLRFTFQRIFDTVSCNDQKLLSEILARPTTRHLKIGCYA
jgi:hypothetical protein